MIKNTNSKIIILGGFGYVGGRLSKALVEKGYEVVLGTRSKSTPIYNNPPAPAKNVDFECESSLCDLFEGFGCVVHLAGPSEKEAALDPVGVINAKAASANRIFRAAKSAGVSRIIYASTAHVYGAPLTGLIAEETNPNPMSPYARASRAAEEAFLAQSRTSSLATIIVRLSNCFGAPVGPNINRWNLLVNNLCLQAAHSQDIILKSPPDHLRDFIPMEDATRAIIHLIELPWIHIGNGIFNVGGEDTCSLLEMAERVRDRARRLIDRKLRVITNAPLTFREPYFLDYRIDKLKGSGYVGLRNRDMEIDNTIKLCLQMSKR